MYHCLASTGAAETVLPTLHIVFLLVPIILFRYFRHYFFLPKLISLSLSLLLRKGSYLSTLSSFSPILVTFVYITMYKIKNFPDTVFKKKKYQWNLINTYIDFFVRITLFCIYLFCFSVYYVGENIRVFCGELCNNNQLTPAVEMGLAGRNTYMEARGACHAGLARLWTNGNI